MTPSTRSTRIYGGPEYETIGAFGSNCGVDDLRAISKANELCNAYSLDTICCRHDRLASPWSASRTG